MSARHIIITGAGTGIGRAIAVLLGGRGHRLTLLARRTEPLEHTARSAREQGAAEVHVASSDIRDRFAVDRAVESGVRTLGPVSAVIANAGIGGENRPVLV